jgi:hypothetical protein
MRFANLCVGDAWHYGNSPGVSFSEVAASLHQREKHKDMPSFRNCERDGEQPEKSSNQDCAPGLDRGAVFLWLRDNYPLCEYG